MDAMALVAESAIISCFSRAYRGSRGHHNETHLPAVDRPPQEDPRLSRADEDGRGRAVINARRAKGRKRVAV
jgi:hypothetical protein